VGRSLCTGVTLGKYEVTIGPVALVALVAAAVVVAAALVVEVVAKEPVKLPKEPVDALRTGPPGVVALDAAEVADEADEEEPLAS